MQFSGIESKLHKISPAEVEFWRKPIEDTTAKLNAVIVQIDKAISSITEDDYPIFED